MADSKQTNVVDAHVFTPEGLYSALQEYGWHISDGIDDCSGTDKVAEFANASGLSLMIREAIDAAVAAEREACAKIAECYVETMVAIASGSNGEIRVPMQFDGSRIAATIRARSDTPKQGDSELRGNHPYSADDKCTTCGHACDKHDIWWANENIDGCCWNDANGDCSCRRFVPESRGKG